MLQRRLLSTFKPGDIALIRSIFRPDKNWLSKPLQVGGRTGVNEGDIIHDDLFNQKSRTVVKSSTGTASYIVTQASTEEYITMCKREAQPIYPLDAAAIVNLGDFHFDSPELTDDNKLKDSPIQILEAGTGHGSLSLAICSKLHITNAFLEKFGVRGGVLHSIDCNKNHSRRGEITVEQFKRGLYKNDIKFHIAESPTDWLQNQSSEWKALESNQDTLEENHEGFLSGAFLDMPDIPQNIKEISKNLKQDAPLIIFCPSVTQILDVIKTIRESEGSIKLTHIRTVELPPGIGGGLQDWDVRYTKIRATDEFGVVCRPKVGGRAVGGGFVAVFKKLSNDAQIKSK